MRISALYVSALFIVVTLAVALPMSFEFRQLVSIQGISIIEILLLPLLLLLFVHRPRAFFPIGYQHICMLLYLFLTWATARGIVGVIEGNELGVALRGLRHYLPLLILPPLLYLLNIWRPDANRALAKLIALLILGYFVYMSFLVIVVVSPSASDVLMMEPFLYRITSSTTAISMTLLLFGYLLWKEKLLGAVIVGFAVLSVGVTLLLAQSRMGSAMLAALVVMAVCLYTARTLRTRFIAISGSMLSTVLVALVAGFLSLSMAVSDFERFSQLLIDRIQRDQLGVGVLESVWTHSFGTESMRNRVVNKAATMPAIGFGEGMGVGETMSKEDGAYIDSTLITMWYKNGAIGVVLFYAFWFAIARRFFRSYMRYRSRFRTGVASIATASVLVWMLWSAANVFLMYGWVLYPIIAIIGVALFLLQEGEHRVGTTKNLKVDHEVGPSSHRTGAPAALQLQTRIHPTRTHSET